MKTATILAMALLFSLSASDRGGKGTIDVLFTGDDRGWVVPSG